MKNNSINDGKAFIVLNYILLSLVAIVMIYPILNVVAIAFSDNSAYLKNPMRIWPENFNMEAFKYVFSNKLILTSYKNTIFVTLVGTLLDLMLLVLTAYPLSKKHLRGKKVFMNLIVFTMLFNGGLIPNFYLVRGLGLIDSLWALILPSMLAAFNIILLKSFLEGLPESLEEAAKIDGAGELSILFRIVIPLSKPILATLALFVAVAYWNSFFNAVVYTRTPEKWTLQLVLREIVMMSDVQFLASGGNSAEISELPPNNLKYATLLVVILPIMCIYPFLQKYFVKGVMIGAVKG